MATLEGGASIPPPTLEAYNGSCVGSYIAVYALAGVIIEGWPMFPVWTILVLATTGSGAKISVTALTIGPTVTSYNDCSGTTTGTGTGAWTIEFLIIDVFIAELVTTGAVKLAWYVVDESIALPTGGGVTMIWLAATFDTPWAYDKLADLTKLVLTTWLAYWLSISPTPWTDWKPNVLIGS